MTNQAFNPFLPSWEYVPDGEPRVFGDRVYLYGSHDKFNGKDFCLNDYVCWSAPLSGLNNWRYEGVIYRKEQDPRNPKGKMHMCAPDCVQGVDGKYYLYYQLHALQCTSVAVSNTPTGPFQFYGYVQHPDGIPWGEKRGDSFAFDPGALVDEDGQAYLYVGFSTDGLFKKIFQLRGNRVEEAVCLRLDADMKTVIGEEHPIVPGPKRAKGTPFEEHPFFEASSMRKINGRYYYVYSSTLSHELCYAVSDHPDRDFLFGGTLVSIADLGYQGNTHPMNYTGNTHGGMTCLNGDWYVFYHRQTNKQKCARQACAEKLTILPDGSIPQVEVTSCGLNNRPLRGKGYYEARIACQLNGKDGILKSDTARKMDKENLYPYFTQSGEDREKNGDQYIANLRDGAWAGFKYFLFDGSEQSLRVTARGTAEGKVKVFYDRKAKPVAVVSVHPAEEWKSFSARIHLPSGAYPLYFIYEGVGAMNLLSFEIE